MPPICASNLDAHFEIRPVAPLPPWSLASGRLGGGGSQRAIGAMLRCRRCAMWTRGASACDFCGSDFGAVAGAKLLHRSPPSFNRREAAGNMSAEALRALCKDEGGPTSPGAVTRLHLACCGFTAISQHLAQYCEVGCAPYYCHAQKWALTHRAGPQVETLSLEKNKLARIEHLEPLTQLTCLFLQGGSSPACSCTAPLRPCASAKPCRRARGLPRPRSRHTHL